MAEAADSNLERYQQQNMSAFLVGYTGEVGKVLVQHLALTKPYKKIYLLGRRKVDLEVPDDGIIEQKILDFDKLDEYSEMFKDIDVGYCSLGTTRARAGADGFVRVDHDYVLKTAELAKAGGCKHFTLVSSQGADKNSSFLYTRTKGQVEEALKVMHFDRLSVFRPGVLLCDRQESRHGEAVFRFFLKPVAALFPTAITTPVEVVAKAMVNNAATPVDEEHKFELYENKAIHLLAGNLKKKCRKSRDVDDNEVKAD